MDEILEEEDEDEDTTGEVKKRATIERRFKLSTDLLPFIQRDRVNLCSAYDVSIELKNQIVIVRGYAENVNSFLDYKNTLVTKSVKMDGLNLTNNYFKNKSPEIISLNVDEEKQEIRFSGPVTFVDETVNGYENYKASVEYLVTDIQFEVNYGFLENILLNNDKFYKHFVENISQYMGDDFVGVCKNENDKISLKIISRPNAAEQITEIYKNVRNCFGRKFKQTIVTPLLQGSYLEEEFQGRFLTEVKNLLLNECYIQEENIYICELFNGEPELREYLPNTFYAVQKPINLIFSLYDDIFSLLKEEISIEVQHKPDNYKLLFASVEFNKLCQLSVKVSKKDDECTLYLEGQLRDIAYIKAWMNYFLEKKVKKIRITGSEEVQLNANQLNLITKVIRSIGIKEFYCKLVDHTFGYVYAIDEDKLKDIQNEMNLVVSSYETVNSVPVDAYLRKYIVMHTEKIDREFHSVEIKVLDDTGELLISGSLKHVDLFLNFIREIICTRVPSAEFRQFYDRMGFVVNGITLLKEETQENCAIVGPTDMIDYLYSMYEIYEENKEIDTKILPHVDEIEYRKSTFDKIENKNYKIFLEFDKHTLNLMKKHFLSELPRRTFQLSYYSEDVVQYIDANAEYEQKHDIFESFLKRFNQQLVIKLDLDAVLNDYSIVYSKFVEKLNDLRFSLEFELNIKLIARFDMLEYDVLSILAHPFNLAVLKRELYVEVKNEMISFDTTRLANTEFFKKLITHSVGKTWSFNIRKGYIVFSGPYLYYLFFNILFEFFLFSNNYQLPCNAKIERFGEYAKVFQRSRKLFNEFKQSLPDDLSHCRCEMRAFEDELIIEPTLEIIKNPANSDLHKRYNKAFDEFVENRLVSREIEINYGEALIENFSTDLLKAFIKSLNAEIRLMERQPYVPLLVIAQTMLNDANNVVITGYKHEVDFVKENLIKTIEETILVKLSTSARLIDSIFDLFQTKLTTKIVDKSGEGYKAYKIQAPFIDCILFRAYFDIQDNGRYNSTQLDRMFAQLRHPVNQKQFSSNLNNNFVLDFGHNEIVISQKDQRSIVENESYLRNIVDNSLKMFNYQLNFASESAYRNDLEFCFLYYAPIIFSMEVHNNHMMIETIGKQDVFMEYLKGTISTLKNIGNDLCVQGIMKLKSFENAFRMLNQELNNRKSGSIEAKVDFTGITYKLFHIDALNIFCMLEDMLNRVKVYVYEISSELYEYILQTRFPEHVFKEDTLSIGFEYCNGHMLIYSFENDDELQQVIQKVNQCLLTEEIFRL